MYRENEIDESTAPESRNAGPIAMIVLGATVIGSFLGIMAADRSALPALRIKSASIISTGDGSLLANLKAAISDILSQKAAQSQAQTETRVISTGLPSIGTIHYSPSADSAQLTIDLEEMELVNTGKLSSPHRVYFDLKDIHWVQDSFKGIKTLKALDIDGDLVSRVRIKKREAGITRIVLDLKRCCDFNYLIPHDSPSHLIIQLQPV